jgi:SAM-dependent methyltransferase
MQDYSKTFARFHNQRWLNVNKQIAPHLLEFYQSTAAGKAKMPVLDLGCGTGHIALSFLDRGFPVVAVEHSGNMLALAREGAGRYIESGQAELVHGPLDELPFEARFGLCLAVHDDLNHFEGLPALRHCFENVFQATAAGGQFLFDLYTKHGLQKLNNVIVEDNRQAMAVIRGIYDNARERLYVKFSGFLRVESGLYERFEEMLESHSYGLEDIRRTVQEAGWRNVHFAKYTDLRRPLDEPEKVCRIFVIAAKP